jgi:hypothetical protein
VVLVLYFFAPLFPQLSGSSLGYLFGPFKNFDFSRFGLLIPFFSALTAGYILDKIGDFSVRIFSPASSKEFLFNARDAAIVISLVFILIAVLMIKFSTFDDWLRVGSYRSLTYSPDVVVLAKQEKSALPFRAATLTLRQEVGLYPSLLNYQGIESLDATVDLVSLRAVEVFRLAAEDGVLRNYFYFLRGLGANNQLRLAKDFDPAKVINLPLFSLLNVKYIVSDNLINSPDLKLVPTPSAADWTPWEKMSQLEKIKLRITENFTGKKVLIYENKNAFPRFFLTKKVKSFISENDLLAGLATSTALVLRENVFLVKGDADKIFKLSGSMEKISVVKYSSDEIKLKVESDGPSVLVVGNNFSPFWEVYVNGEKKEIMPAYHSLQSVVLTATTSEVNLIYNPPYKIKNIKF